MLDVICARWGLGFHGYPEKLERAVKRHLTVDHRFHCFEGGELYRYAPERFWSYPSSHSKTLYRGYPLLFCFHPELPVADRVLFLGLDVVITGSLDELVQMPGEFIAIRDWGQGNFNNSVLLYDAHKRPDVYLDFPPENAEVKTEQDWLSERFPHGRTWPEEWCKSYKFHCENGVPEGCKVVVFHGEPKNHQVSDSWVKENW